MRSLVTVHETHFTFSDFLLTLRALVWTTQLNQRHVSVLGRTEDKYFPEHLGDLFSTLHWDLRQRPQN